VSRSSESIAFANQYRREVQRLEKYHANNITPGSMNWRQALRARYTAMHRAGSPIKQSAILKGLFMQISEIKPEERTIFALAHYNSKRAAALTLATIDYGGHPLTGPIEDGVCIDRTTITVQRNGESLMSGGPLVYISQHAIERMHERRSRPLSLARATQLISGIAILGVMVNLEAHDHAAMCLNLDDELLAVGDIRHVGNPPDKKGRITTSEMYDVRSFLCVGEMESFDKRLAQGNAALAAVKQWIEDPSSDTEELIKSIPVLSQQRETYTAQTAKIVEMREDT